MTSIYANPVSSNAIHSDGAPLLPSQLTQTKLYASVVKDKQGGISGNAPILIAQHGNLIPTSLNSMSLRTANSPAPKFSSDNKLNQWFKNNTSYKFYPIRKLDILLNGSAGKSDVETNGTFFYNGSNTRSNYVYPAGPMIIGGKYLYKGSAKSAHRGAVAILKDGTLLIGRQNGSSRANLDKQFGDIRHLMSGGVLLIENGKKVSFDNIRKIQKFDQSQSMQHGQLYKTNHIILAIKKGQAYLIVAHNKDGTEMQNDLNRIGFTTALKLDGGQYFHWKELNTVHNESPHPFKLDIDVKGL